MKEIHNNSRQKGPVCEVHIAGLFGSAKTFDIERKLDNCGESKLKKAFLLRQVIIFNP